MKSQVTFFLPGLLQGKSPTMVSLLSRAHKVPGPTTVLQALHGFFPGLAHGELPSAALTALSYHQTKRNDETNWCFASLSECLVTHQTAYILGNDHLSINNNEKNALYESLNGLCQEEGLNLYSNDSLDWLCQCQQPTALNVEPLLEVLNKDLTQLLPKGETGAYWNRLITMAQMQLQTCDVNKHRTLMHQPQISCVWFWGMGTLPKTVTCSFDAIYTNNRVLTGLGLLADCPVLPMSATFTDIDTRRYKNILIYDDSFYRQVKHQAQESFNNTLDHYEKQWFMPLKRALSSLNSVQFVCAQGTNYHVNSVNIKFFWRKHL